VIACLRLPYFAVTAHEANSSADVSTPVLVARYQGGRGRIIGVCAQAEQAGVTVGMTMSRARALCPTAQVTLLAPSRVRRALETLQTALMRYSQWSDVERDGLQTAILYVDLGKLMPRDGRSLAEQIIDALQRLGFSAAIGLGSGKFTARVAAEQTPVGAVCLVGRGEEAAFLAPHPVALLPLDKETTRRLNLLGLQRMGQLAGLPRSALIAQFGKLGERLHRLASGEDLRRVARYTPPATESALKCFDPPLEDRLILDVILAACADTLMARLSEQNLACREITLTVRLDNRVELDAQVRPRDPISRSAVLKRVVQALAQKLTLTAGVVSLEMRLGRLAPLRPRQLSLFETLDTPDPREALLDLAERYGESVFYRISVNPVTSNIPEWRFLLEKIEAA
jgi:nucleotidyltransferase/DNA polymerase involved in DNA repair